MLAGAFGVDNETKKKAVETIGDLCREEENRVILGEAKVTEKLATLLETQADNVALVSCVWFL